MGKTRNVTETPPPSHSVSNPSGSEPTVHNPNGSEPPVRDQSASLARQVRATQVVLISVNFCPDGLIRSWLRLHTSAWNCSFVAKDCQN